MDLSKATYISNNTKPIDPTQSTKEVDLSKAVDFRSMPSSLSYIANSVNRNAFVGNTGIGKSKFDNNIPLSQVDNLQAIRAVRQPVLHQMFNATVGGVASGLMTAVEDLAYIADVPNLINIVRGLEHVESNWLSDIMKEGKEGLNEHLPIYRTNPEKMFDFSNSGWYFEMFKGMLDSAVGFGLVGMTGGAVVKGAGNLLRQTARAGRVTRMKAYGDVVGKGIADGKLGNVTAAFITNYGEGKMMGLELYEDAKERNMESFVNDYKSKNNGEDPDQNTLERFEAESADIAGTEANYFMLKNALLIPIEHAQLKSMFKATGLTRSKAVKPGFGSFIKSQLHTAPKEAGEEILQNVFQMEGVYQAEQKLKEKGINITDPISTTSEWLDRYGEFATSEQALLEGMMGFFSGPIQYTITTAPFRTKKVREAEMKRYTDQQEQNEKNKEFLENKLGLIIGKEKLKQAANDLESTALAELNEDKNFDNLALDNFARGTTDNLEAALEEAMQSDEYTDAEKKKIEAKLERLLDLEKQYVKFNDYSNPTGLLNNRLQQEENEKIIGIIQDSIQNNTDNALKELKALLTDFNKRKADGDKVSLPKLLEQLQEREFVFGKNEAGNKTISFEEFKKQLIATEEGAKLAKSPKKLQLLYGNSNVTGALFLAENKRNRDKNTQELMDQYNDMAGTQNRRKYDLGFERLLSVINDNQLTGNEKIEQLNTLLEDTNNQSETNPDNPTLAKEIKDAKHTYEEILRTAEEKANAPVDTEAANSKAKRDNIKSKKTGKSLESIMGTEADEALPTKAELDAEFETTLDEDEKALLNEVKAAKFNKAVMSGDTDAAVEASLMSLKDLKEELDSAKKNNPEIDSAQAEIDEANELKKENAELEAEVKAYKESPEYLEAVEKKTIQNEIDANKKEDTTESDEDILNAVNEAKAAKAAKEKVEGNVPTENKDEIEVLNYSSKEATKVNNKTQQNQGNAEVNNSNVDVKVVIDYATGPFKNFILAGVDRKDTPVSYSVNQGILNNSTVPDYIKSKAIFDKYKKGEAITDAEKTFMIDNLPLSVKIDVEGVEGATAPLFSVRPREDNKNAATAERKLRLAIIDNLIKGKIPKGTISGGYGGNLKLSDTLSSIKDIPDIKNKSDKELEDLEIMYVDEKGVVRDSSTKERSKTFPSTQVMLDTNNGPKPMAGALIISVAKANGDSFPLVVNPRSFTSEEIRFISHLLRDLITPNTDGTNTFTKTVRQEVLDIIKDSNASDLAFLGDKVTYAEALNFFMYQNSRITEDKERITSNVMTEIYVEKGILHFGSESTNFTEFTQNYNKISEFLSKYKNRRVDLKRMNDPAQKAYKLHIINSGVIQTNADTTLSNSTEAENTKGVSRQTLFESQNLQQSYKTEGERTSNRYRSATVYVSNELTNEEESEIGIDQEEINRQVQGSPTDGLDFMDQFNKPDVKPTVENKSKETVQSIKDKYKASDTFIDETLPSSITPLKRGTVKREMVFATNDGEKITEVDAIDLGKIQGFNFFMIKTKEGHYEVIEENSGRPVYNTIKTGTKKQKDVKAEFIEKIKKYNNFESIIKNATSVLIDRNRELKALESNKTVIESKVKKGVSDVFESNPELSSIGNEQQYSEYIETIFPDSEVKDIFYHGSPVKGLQEITRGTDTQRKMYGSVAGITFTDNEMTASIYAGQIEGDPTAQPNWDNGQVYPVLLDIKNSTTKDFGNSSYGGVGDSAMGIYNEALLKAKKEGKDAFIATNIADPAQNQTNYVIFNSKQGHVLGSKKDVKGFKDFVDGKKLESSGENVNLPTNNKVEVVSNKTEQQADKVKKDMEKTVPTTQKKTRVNTDVQKAKLLAQANKLNKIANKDNKNKPDCS